ncbi:SPOR domain-containing protein [Pseudomonas sp. TMP9]|uniref:SPOR domain-containing protein n=1 Tax=unclassified Pseudomonas TaxID=196821 RepID=UPI0030CA82F9
MRWMFLWLVVLNLFYYVWHQQQAPLRVTEIAPLTMAQDSKRDIRLLSESSAPPKREAAEVQPIEAVCLFLGSFELMANAAALEQRLLSLDIQSRVQSMDAAAGVDYWVYLPPLASRQASLRQLRELQARKINSYIITQGDLANGVSLGIFPRSDSAQSVMQRLRDAGYEPSLRELTRAHRSFWVRISPQSRRLADDALLERLALDFKGLEQQLMPCEGVASTQ